MLSSSCVPGSLDFSWIASHLRAEFVRRMESYFHSLLICLSYVYSWHHLSLMFMQASSSHSYPALVRASQKPRNLPNVTIITGKAKKVSAQTLIPIALLHLHSGFRNNSLNYAQSHISQIGAKTQEITSFAVNPIELNGNTTWVLSFCFRSQHFNTSQQSCARASTCFVRILCHPYFIVFLRNFRFKCCRPSSPELVRNIPVYKLYCFSHWAGITHTL